jgi:hypothetical protein
MLKIATACAVSMLATMLTPVLASAAGAPAPNTVMAKLVCGPHSGGSGSQLGPFQADISFTVVADQLNATRSLKANGGGQETFSGLISPQGSVLITGKGEYASGARWLYEFKGMRNPKADTMLEGKLVNTAGIVGTRACTLTFFKKQAAI